MTEIRVSDLVPWNSRRGRFVAVGNSYIDPSTVAAVTFSVVSRDDGLIQLEIVLKNGCVLRPSYGFSQVDAAQAEIKQLLDPGAGEGPYR